MAMNTIDRTAKQIVLTVQDYSLFAGRAFLNLFRPPIYWTDFLIQSDIIGVGSLPIVILSGFFTGGVLALQSAATLSEFGATAVTGQFVSLTMIRELGAVLTGIMVAGRNASSMASELGSMVVTEQIDAMRALGVDPMRKLVTPRIFASIAMLLLAHHRGRCLRHPGRRGGDRLSQPSERHAVLPHGLRAPSLSRHHPGTGQAALLRLHPRFHRLFLRDEDHRRHRGRGPLHHFRPWSTLPCSSSPSTSSSRTSCFPSFPHEPRRRPSLLPTPAPPPDASPVVALRDVSIAFDGPPVLKDITFLGGAAERRASCSDPPAWAKASCSS